MCGLSGMKHKLPRFRKQPGRKKTPPMPDPSKPGPPGRVGTGRRMVLNLGAQIKGNLVKSAYLTFNRDGSETTFMPEGQLKNLFTNDAVKQVLKNCSEGTYRFIHERANKVFATLILIDKAEAIKDFETFGVCDNYLPIALEPDISANDIYHLVSKRDEKPLEYDVALDQLSRANSPWSLTDWAIDSFCESQWKFLAPVFSHNSQHREFPSRIVLPFWIPPGAQPTTKPSTFSTVYQAWVHPSNHKFEHPEISRGSGGPVAVKKLSVDVSVVEDYNVETAYKNERESLKVFQDVQNDHLIKALCTFQHGDNGYYIMFPWATANLREYWGNNYPGNPDGGPPTADSVSWMLEQLVGLSKAIKSLHFLKYGNSLSPSAAKNKDRNCRHGDLKPDNILVMGVDQRRLVIADVGLAKVHGDPTRAREEATRSITGTERYEPPDILHGGARSRAYDIWSFGCICLEFIVWILYGPPGLSTLHKDILAQHKFWFSPDAGKALEALKSETDPEASRKESDELDRLKRQAFASCTINDNIRVLLEKMKGTDPRCSNDTPIKRLLDLAESRLLVIGINRGDRPPGAGQFRADANEMSRKIEAIHDEAVKDEKFLSSCLLDFPMPRITPEFPTAQASSGSEARLGDRLPNRAVPDHALPSQRVVNPPTENIVTRAGLPSGYRGVTPLDDIWTFSGDDNFARNLFRKIKPSLLFPSIPQETNMKNDCAGLDIWEGGFSFRTSVAKLQTEQQSCHLCLIFLECINQNGKSNEPHVEFFRIGSTFSFSRYQEPVLSIIGHPDLAASAPVSLQLGFPQLPSMKSTPQIALLREWIRVCDASHGCWSDDKRILPTRILDVNCPGHEDASTIKLVEASSVESKAKYVALSHRWGTTGPSMRATSEKIKHLTQGFKTKSLPQTFQDAVCVTKVLGLRYLWIDCLCIIQDSDEDWLHESVRMEDVFANAYCTIAATRAQSSEEGFLSQERVKRRCEALRPSKGSPYYVCDRIDDFREDVENSELNQRGWVLQERALSRRTIYFAKSQIYWECGKGVYCETLTKLHNRKSALLGDAHFPQYIENLSKDDKINYFISLYEQYSTRSFTFAEDRQVAILGIERRLLRSLGTTGAYGVFEAYLHRTLLWQRSKDQPPMRLLSGRLGRKVPSWSWMAYDGSISYMKAPYGEVTWNSKDMSSPFKNMTVDSEGLLTRALELEVLGQELDIGYEPLLKMDQIVLDCGSDIDRAGWLVVVLGEEKPARIKVSRRIYMILVSPLKGESTGLFYRRIGAGTLPGREVIKSGSGKTIRVR